MEQKLAVREPVAPSSPQPPVAAVQKIAAAAPKTAVGDSEDLWQKASNLNDFYKALQSHSLYQKSMRLLSFFTPKESKANAPYLLVFHSPQEWNADAKGLLERLFKKLGIDLEACSISFFIKSNSAVMPREKKILGEMLQREIAMLNPERIIFFRESPRPEQIETQAKIDANPITFAGKQAITLYSPLEMLPSKEKMVETWNLFSKFCQCHSEH
ncbi:MAG: hypothetical protein LBH25_13500 [Fibromonadaceae bacterium]|nr:hypothetical protein [Fibromonadaceae bacterium]